MSLNLEHPSRGPRLLGSHPTLGKLLLLTSLYFSQGLPFGFFTQALPVLLRKQGVSLAAIGSTSLLAMPWMLKFLWAPWVDRHGSARWGARRVWIVPLQALSVLLLGVLSFVDLKAGLWLVFAGVFMANLLAATQDVATDALAVDLLSESERGLGNGVQVAGYRVGMIVGGGLLLVAFEQLGWTRSCWIMAALLLFASVPIWMHHEAPRPAASEVAQVAWQALVDTLKRPSLLRFLPVLLTYKMGDAFGSPMLRPFLVDAGQTLSDIGWTLGTFGFVAGLLGALAGGALTGSMSRRNALATFAVVHALCLGFYGLCAWANLPAMVLLAAIACEHFAGGMATAALFTTMMDHTEPQSAATDYTVQASLVLAAGGLFALPSGWIAQRVGYGVHFGLGMLLGLGALAVVLSCIAPLSAIEKKSSATLV